MQHQKLQKKIAKRDQAALAAAQHESDISKVCQVLELQSLMDNLSEDVRADFLNGTNGAVVSCNMQTWNWIRMVLMEIGDWKYLLNYKATQNLAFMGHENSRY